MRRSPAPHRSIAPLTLLAITLASAPLAAQQAPPTVKMSRWLSSVINGEADAAGQTLLIARGRHTALASGVQAGKAPKVRELAKAPKGHAMGMAHLSPDGRFGALFDDDRNLQLIAIEGGAVLGRARASHVRLTQDTALSWINVDPRIRRLINPKPRPVGGGIFTRDFEPPQPLASTCALTRHPLRAGAPAQTLTIPRCRNILHVTPDGQHAIIGVGGYEERFLWQVLAYGGQRVTSSRQEIDVYDTIARVDLNTMDNAPIAEGSFMRVQVSQDGRTFCADHPDLFLAPGDARVSCYRDGVRQDHTLPAPSDGQVSWRWSSLSPDGSKLAISLTGQPVAGQETPSVSHVIDLTHPKAAPLLTSREHANSLVWLPDSQRILLMSNQSPATLHDLREGWQLTIGTPKQAVSGVIRLGDRSDRFLVGVERKNTRDMWLVELDGAPAGRK